NVEGNISVICFHPYLVAQIIAFKQRETITQACRLPGAKQVYSNRAVRFSDGGITQTAQICVGLPLHARMESGGGPQVQPVELIERDIQQLAQPVAHHIDAFVSFPRYHRWLLAEVTKFKCLLKSGLGERRTNSATPS